jgi:hypothetical protein
MASNTEYADYCKTCRRALNRYQSPSGQITYTHAGSEWKGAVEDHRPVPVPLHEIDNPIMFCDFCSAANPTWSYLAGSEELVIDHRAAGPRVVSEHEQHVGRYANRIRTMSPRELERLGVGRGVLASNYGRWWATCAGCAPFLDNGDVLGLVSRVTSAMPSKLTNGKKLIALRGRLIDLYEPLLPLFTLRMPYTHPSQINHTDVV